ncbi:hypothetical protein [Roseovarius sp. D0-M9]|uniref:hypothetical protein n=1 Tax=Roseovarius sp. D0-M9 TaxID=3127117 RepID=UPI0030102ABF
MDRSLGLADYTVCSYSDFDFSPEWYWMRSLELVWRTREKKLAAQSELFEVGELETAPTIESFVRRANTVMARRRADMEKKTPPTSADAINAKGELRRHAELVVLGNWLIAGSPGANLRPGRQPDTKKILKCVAAIMAEIKLAVQNKKRARKDQGREGRKREITKHALARQWTELFDEKIKPSNLDATLRSAKRILADYLQHLESGSATHGGKKVKTSPEIKRALDAITGLLPGSRTGQSDIFAEPDVHSRATLVPFEIALEYQSEAHAEEYRRLPSSTKLASRLRYVPTAASATSSSGRMRADREGRITMKPDANIRRDYRFHALIDRMVITLQVNKPTKASVLNRLIKNKAKATCYVKDILHNQDLGEGWGAPLFAFDPKNLAGYPLAIMIQEPTPDVLAKIVRTIDGAYGIVGSVKLHLIEISVDFYPKQSTTPEEAVLRRERMVGLLQRHHWTRPSLFSDPDSIRPRDADARQIYERETERGKVVPKVRYLFAHENSRRRNDRHETDGNIYNHSIRDRILTTNPGYDIFLNSTVVKGAKYQPFHVSVQHKIADRRSRDENTLEVLADQDRRARIEVTISGTNTLKKRDLSTIDDLSQISFRKLTKDLLTFKLPRTEPSEHLLEDAEAQLRTRGVYGIDLRLRALDLERRKAKKQAGQQLLRKTEREGMGLDDWREMNDVIGDALDELKRRWSGFTTK